MFGSQKPVLLTGALFITAIVWGTRAQAELCSVLGDPVAGAPFNLVDSYCIEPTVSIGVDGGPTSISFAGQFRANDNGQVDVFGIWEPVQMTVNEGQSFTYSSTISWENANPNARFREWVGNFVLPGGPQAFPITDTASAATTPAEFSRTDTSASITDRTFGFSEFPPVPLGRYHVQITGLQANELVTFSKDGLGGTVIAVPEPSSIILVALCLPMLWCVVRMRRG